MRAVGERGEPRAGEEDARRGPAAWRRAEVAAIEQPPGADERDDPERDVDEEDPAPARVLGEHAAGERRDDRRDERRPHEVGDHLPAARPSASRRARRGARPAPSSPRPRPAARASPRARPGSVLSAQPSDASVKIAIAVRKIRRAPNRTLSQPLTGMSVRQRHEIRGDDERRRRDRDVRATPRSAASPSGRSSRPGSP